MSSGEIEYQLRVDTRQVYDNFKSLEQVALRYLTLTNRMGLPDDAGDMIQMLAQIAVSARAAQIAITSLMASTGPLGLLFAFPGLIMAGTSGIDAIQMYMRRRG